MIYRNKWIIKLSHHAYTQATVRGITQDMIEATLKTGTMEWFGKNRVRFVGKYKKGHVVFIGEDKGNNIIKILTIEWRFL